MKIHHKNMKQVFADTQQWVKKNLEPLGVYEFGCNYLDVQKNSFSFFGTNYPWYCTFMEQQKDKEIASRLSDTPSFWQERDELSNLYQRKMNFNKVSDFSKLDWSIRTNTGYELFVITSHRPLEQLSLRKIRQYMHAFSYETKKILKQKSHLELDLEAFNEINQKFHQPLNQQNLEVNNELSRYNKASFGSITLTAKEQLYIEHLMFNMTHKEIAHKHKCSEVAVRKIIMNIKRKVGYEGMSTSRMFQELNKLSILGVCTQAIENF